MRKTGRSIGRTGALARVPAGAGPYQWMGGTIGRFNQLLKSREEHGWQVAVPKGAAGMPPKGAGVRDGQQRSACARPVSGIRFLERIPGVLLWNADGTKAYPGQSAAPLASLLSPRRAAAINSGTFSRLEPCHVDHGRQPVWHGRSIGGGPRRQSPTHDDVPG
jgi:hypothetical protein